MSALISNFESTVRSNVMAAESVGSAQLAINELLFVDAGVDSPEVLLRGVLPGVEAHLLVPGQDPVGQMTALLRAARQAGHTVQRVHVVSHGSPGCLHLGGSELSWETVDGYGEQLRAWFAGAEAAGVSPELLLYGCNVAVGDAGAELLEKLQRYTGAGIAASKDVTGHVDQGGSWELAVCKGVVEAKTAFVTEVRVSYASTFTYDPTIPTPTPTPIYIPPIPTPTPIYIPPTPTPSINHSPIAADKTFSTNEDESLSFSAENFGFSDVDESDSLSAIQIQAASSAGSLTLNDAPLDFSQGPVTITAEDIANLSFTPADNANGEAYATFDFKVIDQAGASSEHANTLTINVTPMDDPAEIGGDTSGSGEKDNNITGTLTATDIDGLTDGTLFSIDAANVPENGTAAIDPATGAWTYSPEANFHGDDSFTVILTDDLGGTTTQEITVSVTSVTNAPTLNVRGLTLYNSTRGSTVSDLFQPETGPATFEDSDGDGLYGVAIVGNNANPSQGEWQFSPDGGRNWLSLPFGSNFINNALVLNAATQIRFSPAREQAPRFEDERGDYFDDQGGFFPDAGTLQAILIDNGIPNSGAPTPPPSGSFINLLSEGTGGTSRYSAERAEIRADFFPAPEPYALPQGREDSSLYLSREQLLNAAGFDPDNEASDTFAIANFSFESNYNDPGSVNNSGNGFQVNFPENFNGRVFFSYDIIDQATDEDEDEIVRSVNELDIFIRPVNDAPIVLPEAKVYLDSSDNFLRSELTSADGPDHYYDDGPNLQGRRVDELFDRPAGHDGGFEPNVVFDIEGQGSPEDRFATYENVDGDRFHGVAVVGNRTPADAGEWQFSVDYGRTWLSVPTGSNFLHNALILERDTELRFVPAGFDSREIEDQQRFSSFNSPDASGAGELEVLIIEDSSFESFDFEDYGRGDYGPGGPGGLPRAGSFVNLLFEETGGESIYSDSRGPRVTLSSGSDPRNQPGSGFFENGTEDQPLYITEAQLLAAADGDIGHFHEEAIRLEGDRHVENLSSEFGSFTEEAHGLFRFDPNPNYNGRVEFTYEIFSPEEHEEDITSAHPAEDHQDAEGPQDEEILLDILVGTQVNGSFFINPVNDAPTTTLDQVELNSIEEDANAISGDTVANLFGSAFSDAADNSFRLEIINADGREGEREGPHESIPENFAGVAITRNAATTDQGRWQWLDGETWTDIAAISSSSALVLERDSYIRFLPSENYNGTPGQLEARLLEFETPEPRRNTFPEEVQFEIVHGQLNEPWEDDHDGPEHLSNGSLINVSGDRSGDTTLISKASVSLTTTVTPINDAPILTGSLDVIAPHDNSYTILPQDLGYIDIDIDDGPGDVHFTVSNFENGQTELNGLPTNRFTGSDIERGRVTFVHDGSNTTEASFEVNVEDGDEDNSIPTSQTFNLAIFNASAPQLLEGMQFTQQRYASDDSLEFQHLNPAFPSPGWVLDLDGASDIALIDFKVKNLTTNVIFDVADITADDITAHGRWGNFDYQLELSPFEGGSYELLAVATDQSGQESLTWTNSFSINNKPQLLEGMQLDAQIYESDESLQLLNLNSSFVNPGWVIDEDGANDIDVIDFQVENLNTGELISLDPLTSDDITPHGRWGNFDFSLPLLELGSGDYELSAVATDQLGDKSNVWRDSFTVINESEE